MLRRYAPVMKSGAGMESMAQYNYICAESPVKSEPTSLDLSVRILFVAAFICC